MAMLVLIVVKPVKLPSRASASTMISKASTILEKKTAAQSRIVPEAHWLGKQGFWYWYGLVSEC